MSSTSNIQFDSNKYARYDHPNFRYDQFVAEEAARSEAATKVTAAALATTPEENAERADNAKLIVGLYLGALRASRPYRDAEADRLAKTPHRSGAYYVNLVPSEKSTLVKPKVKVKRAKRKAKSPTDALGRKSGTQSTSTEQQERQEAALLNSVDPADIEGTNKLAGQKKAAMRKRLEKAFENLKAKVAGADREFYDGDIGVGYKFVLGKVANRMYDAGECSATEHDVTNNILFEFSQNIDKVQNVYSYLANAAWRQGGRAFTENLEDRDTHDPLMVKVENEEGKLEKVDNPGLRGDVVYKRGGKRVFQDSPLRFRRVLPDFIHGVDLKICNYIREGYNYAKIGPLVGLTDAGVES